MNVVIVVRCSGQRNSGLCSTVTHKVILIALKSITLIVNTAQPSAYFFIFYFFMSVINRPSIQFRATVSEAMNEEYSDWLCLYVIKSVCVCVCESQGGRQSWAPVPNKPTRFCGRKATPQRLCSVCVMCVCVRERK